MKAPREAIYQALFELGCQASGLVTKSRRARHWGQVPPSEQPAFFQVQRYEEEIVKGPNMPTKWEFHVEWMFYTNSGGDLTAAPMTQMNPLLDYVDALFPTVPGRRITLGGVVFEARINGRIQTDEGMLGPQSVAIVPLRIVTV